MQNCQTKLFSTNPTSQTFNPEHFYFFFETQNARTEYYTIGGWPVRVGSQKVFGLRFFRGNFEKSISACYLPEVLIVDCWLLWVGGCGACVVGGVVGLVVVCFAVDPLGNLVLGCWLVHW